MKNEDIAICRTAIVSIAKLKSRDAQIAALNKYTEPLRGAIKRGVIQILQGRKKRAQEEQERAQRNRGQGPGR